jgi:hypothetical protein
MMVSRFSCVAAAMVLPAPTLSSARTGQVAPGEVLGRSLVGNAND